MIRSATVEDLDLCLDLIIKSGLSARLTKKELARYLHEKYFLVSQDVRFPADQNLTGFIYGEPLIDNGVVVWFIVVDERYRRCGIGSKLIAEFSRINCDKDWIYLTSVDSSETLKFYNNNGFQERGGKLIEMLKYNQ